MAREKQEKEVRLLFIRRLARLDKRHKKEQNKEKGKKKRMTSHPPWLDTPRSDSASLTAPLTGFSMMELCLSQLKIWVRQ